ncbi:MAG: type II secretion system protein GspC [Myxococcota bacterium]
MTLLRTYGWLVNLGLIAAGTYFVAGATNTVVAQAVRPIPSAEKGSSRAPRAPRRAVRSPEFTRISERNLFNAEKDPEIDPNAPPEVEDTAPGAVTGTDYKEEDLKKCSIAAGLRATLVADENPQWSMAVLYDNSEREPQVFSINPGRNEISSDATLIEIRNRAIVVRRTDRFELCSADAEEKKSRTPRPTVARAPKKDGDDDDDKVEQTGANEYVVDQEYIDETMGNLSQVATQARIVPSFKNGKANGFKLFSIKPGSIYQKIGLQNGDVIQKINGYSIDSPDKALEVYSKLKTSKNVNIELLRRGRAMSKAYEIR